MNDKMKTDLRLVAENDDDGAGNSTRAPLTERQQIIMATRLSLTVNAKIPTVNEKKRKKISDYAFDTSAKKIKTSSKERGSAIAETSARDVDTSGSGSGTNSPPESLPEQEMCKQCKKLKTPRFWGKMVKNLTKEYKETWMENTKRALTNKGLCLPCTKMKSFNSNIAAQTKVGNEHFQEVNLKQSGNRLERKKTVKLWVPQSSSKWRAGGPKRSSTGGRFSAGGSSNRFSEDQQRQERELGEAVSWVVGKGGEKIKMIQEKSRTTITCEKPSTTCCICGTRENIEKANKLIDEALNLRKKWMRKYCQQEVTFEIPAHHIHNFLRENGTIINALQEESKARLHLIRPPNGSENKDAPWTMVIRGTKINVLKAKEGIKKLLFELTVEIPSARVGKVIGKNGANINGLQRNSGAYLLVLPKENRGPRKMIIMGTESNVLKAKEGIKKLLATR